MKKTITVNTYYLLLRQLLVIIALAVLSSLLSACSTVPTTGPDFLTNPLTRSAAIKKDYYDVNIKTHDGHLLRATIFQPALKAHETAPLIIHGHGFGIFRISSPISIYGLAIFSGQAAIKAWNQGYWVLVLTNGAMVIAKI